MPHALSNAACKRLLPLSRNGNADLTNAWRLPAVPISTAAGNLDGLEQLLRLRIYSIALQATQADIARSLNVPRSGFAFSWRGLIVRRAFARTVQEVCVRLKNLQPLGKADPIGALALHLKTLQRAPCSTIECRRHHH